MATPYSLILFAVNHPANVLHYLPMDTCNRCGRKVKARPCCADAHKHDDFICEACCYERKQMYEDDWDLEYPPSAKEIPPISHSMSAEWDGPIWQ